VLPAPTPSGDDSLSEYKGKRSTLTMRDSENTIRYAKTGIASEAVCPARTVPSIFKVAAETKADKIAMRYPQPRV
jgi:hypothetical protein